MNPFELHGFAFLLFYLLVGTVTVWGLHLWIRHSGVNDGGSRPNLTDPYLIATLRAGRNESLRVATVALIDRGLLEANDAVLTTRNNDAVELAQRPIEKAILKHYLKPGKAYEIFKDSAAVASCDGYEKALAEQGLIANGKAFAKRLPVVLGTIGLLIAITTIKVQVALSEGRHNVGFLIVLTMVFCFIALFAWRRRRTGRGDALLVDLRSLFARLRGRAGAVEAGGQTNEAALLAAVFGLAALPALTFPFMRKLYPASAGAGSGCGSSSSSCGSSCSGGCGGGGCGG